MGHARPLLGLALLAVAFSIPRIIAGTLEFDGIDVHYSSQRYFSDALRSGHLPFWTAYLFSGFPFLADLQVGAWYPLNWPFFAAGITPASLSGELLLHTLIACVGAYVLASRMGMQPAAAVAAGMFYGLSGYFAAHSQHVGMFETAAWLPWLVLVLDLLAERLSLRRLALAGLLGAALALPGHFQAALYAFSGAAGWAFLSAAWRRSAAQARRAAIGLLAVGVWGALVSAVMLLPALELTTQSIRTQLDPRSLEVGYFHADSLLTLVLPNYYGLLSGNYSGPGDVTQHYFYAGVLLVPLAVLGVRHARALRAALFLGLPFVWYAIRPPGGLFRLVARLPGFSSVELPMHGWFLPALGLALLGGAGFERAFTRIHGNWLPGVVLFAMFVDVLVFNQLLDPLAFARQTFDALYGPPQRAIETQLRAAQPPVERLYGPPLTAIGYRNHALQTHVETTYGYNPLELAAYAEYADAAEDNPRLVDGLAATHRLVGLDDAIQPNPSALPVAYFAHRLVSLTDAESARTALATLDPAQETLVVGPPPDLQLEQAASVVILERGQDYLTVHYRAASANLLRVAIPWYPGWHAVLNAADLPILAVDRALLGVLVPPGEGDIHIAYTPRFFVLGAVISAVASSIALFILLRTFSRRPAD